MIDKFRQSLLLTATIVYFDAMIWINFILLSLCVLVMMWYIIFEWKESWSFNKLEDSSQSSFINLKFLQWIHITCIMLMLGELHTGAVQAIIAMRDFHLKIIVLHTKAIRFSLSFVRPCAHQRKASLWHARGGNALSLHASRWRWTLQSMRRSRTSTFHLNLITLKSYK